MSNERNDDTTTTTAATGDRNGGGNPFYNNPDGVVVKTVDIWTVDKCRAVLAAGTAPKFLVIDKYAPAGTEGWVYELTKVNKTTVTLTPLGGGRGMRIDPFTLAEADEQDITRHEAAKAAEPAEIHTGSIVRISGPGWEQDMDALWVVVGLKGMEEISIARLGGEQGGRSWPKIPRSYVAAVIAPQGIGHALSLDSKFADGVISE